MLLTAVGAIGVAVLLLATVIPVLQVEANAAIPDAFSRNGWELHGPLLPLLALAGVAALLGCRRGRRGAMAALAGCGLLALLLVLLTDVQEIGSSGLLPGSFAEGFVVAGPGAYLEVLGAVLMLLAGGLLSLFALDE
ncbi:MAG: hypothetical protein F2813_06580 [Actinobacteria bacterium]|uniref:Unannotated protein n=1 Tax=freshwater metagenome TaxID=449393 RepID=A0A6J5ZZT1_9ZZZZ|nr:hypothetical protein [Actinomycetota bacterium]